MRKVGFLAFFLTVFPALAAQSLSDGTRVRRLSVDRGFVIPHHDDMYHLYRLTYSVQYQDLKTVADSKLRLGYMAYGADLGSQTLGYAAAAAVNVERSFGASRNGPLYMGFAMGWGWVSNPYEGTTNPSNRAIGSAGNAFGQLYLGGAYSITPSLRLHGDIRFSHFSNGALKAPNLGINMPSFSIGISQEIKAVNWVSGEFAERLWTPFVSLRAGRKSLDIDDPRAFWVPLIELGMGYRVGKSAQLRFTAAAHADPFYRFEKFEPLTRFTAANGMDMGVGIGYHQKFGPWGMLFDVGWYVYKPNRGYKTPYFEALGLSYDCSKRWTILSRLKANKTTADLIEFGLVHYWD
jgi:hypothetical protein